MAKLALSFHKVSILVLCAMLIMAIMIGSSHFIKRLHSESFDDLQYVTHQLIKQSAYSLGPLIQRHNTSEDNSQQVADILFHLSQQQWIMDISVHQLNGALIARAGDDVSVRERLALDESEHAAKTTRQLVEKIDFEQTPIGFIRLTLDPAQLKITPDSVGHTTKAVWLLLALAMVIGTILTFTLRAYPKLNRRRLLS